MISARRLVLLAMLVAPPAAAQVQSECGGWQTDARNVDWRDPTRTFAEGTIRLVALETGEPACCGSHLMVTWPDPDEPFPSCAVISDGEGGTGFYSLDISAADASYDAARGLSVRLPVTRFDGYGETSGEVRFTVNQATGRLVLD